jgi:hypothetical protein
MSVVVTRSAVRVPQHELFEFVTTPANWPLWHPSSLAVTGKADHSLGVGETCIEHYVVAGHEGETTWVVREKVQDERWVIEAMPKGGGSGKITYRLMRVDGATSFERTLEYTMPSLWLSILDPLVIRRRVRAESDQAVRNLRELLERRYDPDGRPAEDLSAR